MFHMKIRNYIHFIMYITYNLPNLFVTNFKFPFNTYSKICVYRNYTKGMSYQFLNETKQNYRL